jgi:hypothetical protein
MNPSRKAYEEILNMSDGELWQWMLSADTGSYVHEVGKIVMNQRVAQKTLEANREMVKQTRLWLDANIQLDATTRALARATSGIVAATWGVVVITLITQVALICLEVFRR